MKSYVLKNVTRKQTINLLKYAGRRNINPVSSFSDIHSAFSYPVGIVSLHIWGTVTAIRFQHIVNNDELFLCSWFYPKNNTIICNNVNEFMNKIWENSNV